jgi:uncharacterized protein YjeT (DUF2065 family)
MDVNWSDLLNAIALVLIIEGLLPFISPSALKRTYESIQKMPDSTLRTVGFACVVVGAVLLLL